MFFAIMSIRYCSKIPFGIIENLPNYILLSYSIENNIQE